MEGRAGQVKAEPKGAGGGGQPKTEESADEASSRSPQHEEEKKRRSEERRRERLKPENQERKRQKFRVWGRGIEAAKARTNGPTGAAGSVADPKTPAGAAATATTAATGGVGGGKGKRVRFADPLFVVYEYVGGGTLSGILDEDGKLMDWAKSELVKRGADLGAAEARLRLKQVGRGGWAAWNHHPLW